RYRITFKCGILKDFGFMEAWKYVVAAAAVGGMGYLIFKYMVKPILAPGFEVVSVTTSPSTISLGQSTTVTVRVKNTTDSPVSGKLPVKANGTEIQTIDVSLTPGEEKDYSFTWTPAAAATYSICA
ncbi:MAG: CARDB domain-containing protein, partial [Pyrobaculum sp.]